MKILITGGAGFVGSNVADKLLSRGDEVLVIDNFATGRRDNLVERDGLTLIEGSIADPGLVDKVFADFGPDVVVHAAASYADPNAWVEDSRTNAVGTSFVVQAAQKQNVKRFIYYQTALCYGLHPDEQPITLDHEIRPGESSYAISKTAGEYYVKLSGLDWISFRLANAYGPRNISGPLPTFFHRLSEDKPCFVMDTRRDFIFIDDLVAITVRAIDGEGESGSYHVSSGGDVSIKELFDATTAAMGISLENDVEVRERHPDDAYTILLDPKATHDQFQGWKADHDLADGVKRTVEYYREFGITETYTHLTGVKE